MTDEEKFLADYKITLDATFELGPKSKSTWIKLIDNDGRVLLLDARTLGDHLCVDAHPFIDGQKATVAPWGMTRGRGHAMLGGTGFTSHGWPSVNLGILILGKQEATS